MKLLPYLKYKKTGIAWLPYVPSHWTVSKVKFKIPFQVGWTPPTGVEANFVGENLWANISDLKSKFIEETKTHISDDAAAKASMEITPKGSLLYSFKLSVGTVAFAGRDLYTNEAIASFLPNENINISFLYYAAPEFIEKNASKNIYGASILNQELIRNATLIAPRYSEQTQIAAFLDRETAKIDLLIEKQLRLIELLEEKRQAAISHAVTKGLNSDVQMKDSGVEWLGKVPEHWDVVPLKYLVRTSKGIAFKSSDFTDYGVGVVKASDIKQGSIRSISTCLPESFVQTHKSAMLKAGDIILSTVGSTSDVINSAVGQIGEVTFELDGTLLNQNTVNFKPAVRLNSQFMKLFLFSTAYRKHLDLHAHGTANQASLSLEDMLSFGIALPSVSEQARIISHVNKTLNLLDSLIKASKKSTLLSSEKKQALISAAVTGKIDVRDQVPQDVEEAVAS